MLSLFVAAGIGSCGSAKDPPITSADDGSFDQVAAPFLKKYCVDCHGPEQAKSERRFDRLAGQIQSDDDLVDYQEILDLLNLSEMPPSDAPQPTDAERRSVIDWLSDAIAKYHRARKPSSSAVVLRRINAREYRNTLRDLLHVDTTIFDPTLGFPTDQTFEQLDNNGEALVTSSFLLARYLEAADIAIGKALYPIKRPEVQTWTFRDNFRQQPEIDRVHQKVNGHSHLTLYDVIGADKPEGAYGPLHDFAEGVPHDGTYEIRIHAEAVNRDHPYDDEFLGRDRTEPLKLGIVPGNHLVGDLHLKQPIEPLLAEVDLADQPQWYTVRVPLDAGFTPRFTFRNGLMDARNLWSRLIRKYPDQFPKGLKGIVVQRQTAIAQGKLPQIHIHEVQIRGPLYENWPRNSQLSLLGSAWESAASGEFSMEQVRPLLKRFASRAYRQEATDDQIDRVQRVVQQRADDGVEMIDAFADGLKMILCSPNFLYIDTSPSGELSSTAIASRLAYFLWSSCPDDELLALGRSNKLRDPKILEQQVQRMLQDERSDAMVHDFLDSWLGLRQLGSAPPDRSNFRPYYQYDLEAAMRQETDAFMRHLLDENMSVRHFLDSDFTFVNRELAKFYGTQIPQEAGFQKVALTNRRRGGLLGQASVLTVSANGIETSPIVRGVWLLENLLGTPPKPPPPDVEPLDPDVRGSQSIRDQLARHREIATCNECHRKIDPLGFALESFDPIGRIRNRYQTKVEVDPSGELPDGQSFEDIIGLKRILLGRTDQFAAALLKKLLAYATGREMSVTDRPEIDRIVGQLGDSDYRLRDMVTQVVLSKPFLTK